MSRKGQSKYPEQTVNQILDLWDAGESAGYIALAFGMSRGQVMGIISRAKQPKLSAEEEQRRKEARAKPVNVSAPRRPRVTWPDGVRYEDVRLTTVASRPSLPSAPVRDARP